jgi:hypothetical protein
MNQANLVKALGDFSAGTKYVLGKIRVGGSRLPLIASALKASITELFGGASETHKPKANDDRRIASNKKGRPKPPLIVVASVTPNSTRRYSCCC